MPQGWLPLIPGGVTPINDVLSVEKKDGRWFYFCGLHPVFFHDEDDRPSFRMFTAQLICQGMCRQKEIIRAFGVSKNSVARSVKKYGEGGADAFFVKRKGRGGGIITEAVRAEAQELLNQGYSKHETAEKLGIKYDTLRKAVSGGRLSARSSGKTPKAVKDKSARSEEDAAAEMGTACTRPMDRCFAAVGLLPEGAPTRFEPSLDVSFGGVLCALPALSANGLFSHVSECLKTLGGYYTTLHVLMVVAYMALCRIKTVEQLQYHPPGELGKLLGLDRIPEVRCLRGKLASLSDGDAPLKWSQLLSRDWMEKDPAAAGVLYVDGHVRVYHGYKTELPKRFVSRQRLCLRGTTDYWVNDQTGKPFFVVDRPVDQGMLEALRNDIVPRLLADVPNQPTEEQLKADSYRHRFVMIFDREGYSPVFFKEMWDKHRIACITYHKFPGDPWPEEWFVDTEIEIRNGERVSLKLAEMGSWIGDKKDGLFVREVRRLCKSGHQTSLISTDKSDIGAKNAALIFSRWSQENFFGYMMKEYAIDLLSEYRTEEFPGTQKVVNPAWRELDRKRRSLKSKHTHQTSRYASVDLDTDLKDKNVVKWERQKASLVLEIEQIEHELQQIKSKLAETPKHLEWQNLADEQKFERLAPGRKRLTDTIKMIAYRAETAMAEIAKEEMSRKDDARSVIRDLCAMEADILPNIEEGVLTVQVHHMSNPRTDRAVQHLLTHLNEAAFNYPGTKLRLFYRLVSRDPQAAPDS